VRLEFFERFAAGQDAAAPRQAGSPDATIRSFDIELIVPFVNTFGKSLPFDVSVIVACVSGINTERDKWL
jgi:hypothetical protein